MCLFAIHQGLSFTNNRVLKGVGLKIANAETIVDVWVENILDIDKQMINKFKTAIEIIAVTYNCFCNVTVEIFSSNCKSVKGPHHEFCDQILYLHMRKHFNLIKNVKERATKLLSQLRELDYESMQRVLKFQTFAYKLKGGTMI